MPLSRLCSHIRFAALDFESAGAEPGDTDTPVQIGITSSLLGAAPETWTSYISTDKPILWSAARIHGITKEHLRNAPAFPELWPAISARLRDCVLVGHNLGTEKRFLRAFPGHGFGPWLDTLILSRECLPGLDDYSLGTVCGVLGLVPEVEELVPEKSWHDALFDAAASFVLLRCLVRELQLEQSPLYMLGNAIREK